VLNDDDAAGDVSRHHQRNGIINNVDLCLKGCNVYLQNAAWEIKWTYLRILCFAQ